MNDQFSVKAGLHLLAISGSLRTASANTTVLRAAVRLAPEHVVISLYDGLGDLPHFDPDLDGEIPPRAVRDFRARLAAADAVLLCSPEYAHGVPGGLKNALDWIVSSGEFMGKPVAIVNARPASTFAQASLRETLSVMMAEIDEAASVTLPRRHQIQQLVFPCAIQRAAEATISLLKYIAGAFQEGTALPLPNRVLDR